LQKKEAKNMAYQALFLADGVVFLFKKTSVFTPAEVTATIDKGEVFIELGRNVIKITEKIIKNLKKHKTIFLYETPEKEYDPDSIPIAFEMKTDAMDKLEALWREKNNARQGEPAHRTHRAAGNNQH